MLQAVIFDMDGVMIDTDIIHSRAFEKLLLELGITPEKNEQGTVHISGMTTEGTWEVFKERYGFEADISELSRKKQQIVMDAMQHVQPMPGLLKLLKDLKKHNIRLAVATSAQQNRAKLAIDKLGIASYFATVVTAKDVALGKPAPDIYLVAAKKLGLDPAACVVLEDAPAGVQAGAAAGIKVVAVPHQYTRRMDFSLASLVVDSLEELDYKKLSKLLTD